MLVILAFTSLACAQAPGNQSDVQWIIEALNIEKGATVADIGAGDGDQTLDIAEYIGPQGTIYSTELGDAQIAELKQAIENADPANITILEGHPQRTNLPEQCCEAIYLRRVYHHITNPKDFNVSLYQSLKPGGKLAIIDFEPRSSEADPEGRSSGNQHGVTAETAIDELSQAGFRLVSSKKQSGRNIYIVMQKPTSD
ncbi:class I SAM-dependent methyltransferase [Fodinibius sp. Rm-B-1B1-1]|uniref:class I SAM-dependent methyltransferase n=1 Tax=Fodinibius alkaliphilus TaxID=3140241 RepID=UPI00315B29EA